MLGRIGSGSAVAALPWAAAIVAATSGCLWLALLFGALTLAVMVFALAPWIPGLRERLSAKRRIRRLEDFWVEGHPLVYVEAEGEPAERTAVTGMKDWHSRTQSWITGNISALDAERFSQPERWYQLDFPTTTIHPSWYIDLRNLTGHRLKELLRLREEQERKLR